MKEAADKACIPELERTYKPKQEIESSKPGKKFAVKTYTTSVSDKEDPTVNATDIKSESSKGNSESKRNCLFCKENHTLDMCKKFSEKPHKEKKSFFFSNYLDVVLAPIIKLKIADIKSHAKCALDII